MAGFQDWCQLHVWKSQVLWRSEVTTSPASFARSGRASAAAERARCGQSPSGGSPLLDVETPLRDGQSPWQPAHPPLTLPATYVCKETQDFSSTTFSCIHSKIKLTNLRHLFVFSFFPLHLF